MFSWPTLMICALVEAGNVWDCALTAVAPGVDHFKDAAFGLYCEWGELGSEIATGRYDMEALEGLLQRTARQLCLQRRVRTGSE